MFLKARKRARQRLSSASAGLSYSGTRRHVLSMLVFSLCAPEVVYAGASPFSTPRSQTGGGPVGGRGGKLSFGIHVLQPNATMVSLARPFAFKPAIGKDILGQFAMPPPLTFRWNCTHGSKR